MNIDIKVGNLTKDRLTKLRSDIRAMRHDSGGSLSPLTIARNALGLPAKATRGDVLAELNSRLHHYGEPTAPAQQPVPADDANKPSDFNLANFIGKQLA